MTGINMEWTGDQQFLAADGAVHTVVTDSVRDVIKLSVEKYCSVVASLKSEIVSTVRVANEEEG